MFSQKGAHKESTNATYPFAVGIKYPSGFKNQM